MLCFGILVPDVRLVGAAGPSGRSGRPGVVPNIRVPDIRVGVSIGAVGYGLRSQWYDRRPVAGATAPAGACVSCLVRRACDHGVTNGFLMVSVTAVLTASAVTDPLGLHVDPEGLDGCCRTVPDRFASTWQAGPEAPRSDVPGGGVRCSGHPSEARARVSQQRRVVPLCYDTRSKGPRGAQRRGVAALAARTVGCADRACGAGVSVPPYALSVLRSRPDT